MFEQQKNWFQSTTIRGAILAFAAGLLPLIAPQVAMDDVTKVVDGAILVVGAALAIYGRFKATAKIGK